MPDFVNFQSGMDIKAMLEGYDFLRGDFILGRVGPNIYIGIKGTTRATLINLGMLDGYISLSYHRPAHETVRGKWPNSTAMLRDLQQAPFSMSPGWELVTLLRRRTKSTMAPNVAAAFGNDDRDLRQTILQLHALVGNLQHQMTTQANNFQTQIDTLKTLNDGRVEEINTLKTENDGLVEKINTLKTQNDGLVEKINTLKTENARLVEETTSLKNAALGKN